jgi:predicted nucleotidyltransferase
VERAHQLIEPYTQRDDVVGIYLIGSASRPYRDELSDYDLEVVIADDAFPSIPQEERLVYVINEGPPRRVDHEFYLRPLAEIEALVNSPHDVFHGPYRNAVVLYDPEGTVAPLIAQLAELPPEVRFDRLRMHYLELRESLARAAKTLDRGAARNVHLLLAEGRRAAVKLLFLQAGAWPTPWHWAQEELEILGVSTEILDELDAVAANPTVEAIRETLAHVDAWLNAAGEGFHEDVRALFNWLYLTPEGKKVHSTWAAR